MKEKVPPAGESTGSGFLEPTSFSEAAHGAGGGTEGWGWGWSHHRPRVGPFGTAMRSLETASERAAAKDTFGALRAPTLSDSPPSGAGLPSRGPTHVMGHLLAQVGFHQEYPGNFLTGPVQDSGNQRVLTVF